MDHQYSAAVYCNEVEIAIKTGNDIEELYIWMLLQVNGTIGDIHGTIIDNKTQEIAKAFRRSPID